MKDDIWTAVDNEDVGDIQHFDLMGGDVKLHSANHGSMLSFTIIQSRKKSFITLLELGADCNTLDRRGKTAIFTAAKKADGFWLKECLTHNGNKDLNNGLPPERQMTVLTHAIYAGSIDCVKVLVDAGVDVNLESGTRDTPLREALGRDEFEIVLLLLESGAAYRAQEPARFSFAFAMSLKKIENFVDPMSKEANSLRAVRDWLTARGADPDKVVCRDGLWMFPDDAAAPN